MLERHELEAFLTLAEELHFGRTAERLRVSTARISQTIAKLERRIGVPLFNRTSRRVVLARQVHTDSVRDALTARRRPLVRLDVLCEWLVSELRMRTVCCEKWRRHRVELYL